MNILLLGLGSNVTQGILKSIKCSNIKHKLYGACVSPDSTGLYMCDEAFICPFAHEHTFIPWLENVCTVNEVDVVLSGVEEILEVIAIHRQRLAALSTVFIVSPAEKLSLGRDKLLTCQWLQSHGFPHPRYTLSSDLAGIDRLLATTKGGLIAKPRWGKGSKGILKIRNHSDIAKLSGLKDYLIQEEIGTDDDEYTIACYADKTGQYLNSIIFQRRLMHGTTSRATVVEDDALYGYAKSICNTLNPIGPLNIQLRLDSQKRPICFELNIRFSGTVPIRAYFGFNDVEAALREHVLGENVSNFLKVRQGIALRYWNEIYITKQTHETLLNNRHIIFPYHHL